METPLHWASLEGHERLVTLLLKGGADPRAKNTSDQTPFDLAASGPIKKILQGRYLVYYTSIDTCSGKMD